MFTAATSHNRMRAWLAPARGEAIGTVLAYFCTSGDGCDSVMLDTLNIKTMESDRLVEPEHKHGSATSINCANHVKRLAASVLERAGVTAARIEKTA